MLHGIIIDESNKYLHLCYHYNTKLLRDLPTSHWWHHCHLVMASYDIAWYSRLRELLTDF